MKKFEFVDILPPGLVVVEFTIELSKIWTSSLPNKFEVNVCICSRAWFSTSECFYGVIGAWKIKGLIYYFSISQLGYAYVFSHPRLQCLDTKFWKWRSYTKSSWNQKPFQTPVYHILMQLIDWFSPQPELQTTGWLSLGQFQCWDQERINNSGVLLVDDSKNNNFCFSYLEVEILSNYFARDFAWGKFAWGRFAWGRFSWGRFAWGRFARDRFAWGFERTHPIRRRRHCLQLPLHNFRRDFLHISYYSHHQGLSHIVHTWCHNNTLHPSVGRSMRISCLLVHMTSHSPPVWLYYPISPVRR